MKTEKRLISVTCKSIPDQNRTRTQTKTVQAGLPLGFHPSMPEPFSHISASSIWHPICCTVAMTKRQPLPHGLDPESGSRRSRFQPCSQLHTTSSTRKRGVSLYVQKSNSGSGQGHVRGVVPVPTGEARHAALY